MDTAPLDSLIDLGNLFSKKKYKKIMKTLDYIPTSKIERATKLVQTGAVSVNYLRYYSGKIVDSGLTRDKLDEDNAEDIYDGLKTLKGSALKVAHVEYGQVFLPQARRNSLCRNFLFHHFQLH
jgi:hypothetical protein